MHPNPRGAEFCRRCGSRDLSLPQPRLAPGTQLVKYAAVFAAALILLSVGLLLISLLLTPLAHPGY
jgi:hypothetical protein